jgi:hypothetical protein
MKGKILPLNSWLFPLEETGYGLLLSDVPLP